MKEIKIEEIKEIKAIEKSKNESEIELKVSIKSLNIGEAEQLMKSKNVKLVYEEE